MSWEAAFLARLVMVNSKTKVAARFDPTVLHVRKLLMPTEACKCAHIIGSVKCTNSRVAIELEACNISKRHH